MTQQETPAAALQVATPAGAAVAGRPLEVTVRCMGVHGAAQGEVELLRTRALTRFQRRWSGAGNTVTHREHVVCARADLEVTGPPTARLVAHAVPLDIPADEATITAFLVQQEYTIRARVQRADGRTVLARASLVVVRGPDRRGPATRPRPDERGPAALRLHQLSTRELAGGEPVSAVVILSGHDARGARAVRVELVLAEDVQARPTEPLEESRHAETVVAAVTAPVPAGVERSRQVRLPVTVRAPRPLPAPSTITSDFTLRWWLRAVLDRPWRSDLTTAVELDGLSVS